MKHTALFSSLSHGTVRSGGDCAATPAVGRRRLAAGGITAVMALRCARGAAATMPSSLPLLTRAQRAFKGASAHAMRATACMARACGRGKGGTLGQIAQGNQLV
jgi:hypothetical protein